MIKVGSFEKRHGNNMKIVNHTDDDSIGILLEEDKKVITVLVLQQRSRATQDIAPRVALEYWSRRCCKIFDVTEHPAWSRIFDICLDEINNELNYAKKYHQLKELLE